MNYYTFGDQVLSGWAVNRLMELGYTAPFNDAKAKPPSLAQLVALRHCGVRTTKEILAFTGQPTKDIDLAFRILRREYERGQWASPE